eukprot:CAMPEP_0173404270 /NCGR_PEP_ID=MMETSP1356-20130122/58943_1 /TAXON_ID=77927 ORGANISM="Hemiselmis virescens, Strain PCC157" /NCGR_SAMPLE_ID=MMETSP1356 /ASSEMBLY_ACC=CAM_ASM_000847 /LENGTH=400 /DNA_ID=CAMNT_0014364919 /DNA_START=84 /DNA_END=1283 /DNA_ORIENTATION=+
MVQVLCTIGTYCGSQEGTEVKVTHKQHKVDVGKGKAVKDLCDALGSQGLPELAHEVPELFHVSGPHVQVLQSDQLIWNWCDQLNAEYQNSFWKKDAPPKSLPVIEYTPSTGEVLINGGKARLLPSDLVVAWGAYDISYLSIQQRMDKVVTLKLSAPGEGKGTTVQARLGSTVRELRAVAAEKLGIEGSPTLMVGPAVLQDEELLVRYLAPASDEGSVVVLTAPQSTCIRFKDQAGNFKTFVFKNINARMTGYELKRMYGDHDGAFPSDQLRFLCDGTRIRDSEMLVDCGVVPDAENVVDVLLFQCGGMFHPSSGLMGFDLAGPDENHKCPKEASPHRQCNGHKSRVSVVIRGHEPGTPPREVTVEAFACDSVDVVLCKAKEAASKSDLDGQGSKKLDGGG